jgi:hypothetical protein
MKKKQPRYWLIFLLGAIAISVWVISPVSAKSVGFMNKDELKGQLGSDDLVILDVRAGKDWKSSEFKIKGATRANPREFSSWKERFDKDKKLVLYCA